MNQIIIATKKMYEYNQLAVERLDTIQKDEKYEVNFFEEVKPYVDCFFQELDQWEQIAADWIKQKKPKYIHRNQVETVKENLQNVVLQSFYKDTKEKRFKKMYHSNKYVLESILTSE
ncbi:DUF1798 family protein [Priestia megaterium]|nr:DUF1798 family protein [Priestia megaterium]